MKTCITGANGPGNCYGSCGLQPAFNVKKLNAMGDSTIIPLDFQIPAYRQAGRTDTG